MCNKRDHEGNHVAHDDDTHDDNKRPKTSGEIEHIVENGIKKYICSIDGCGYKSLKKYMMVRHQITHNDAKPFQCDECSFTCAYSSVLVRHKRTHIGKTTLQCDFEGCDYRCINLNTLTGHKKTHGIFKSFICKVDGCDYRCSRKDKMVEHERTHSGEKRYQCDECDYRGATASALSSHKKTHGRSFQCDFEKCNFKCDNPWDIMRHKKTHLDKNPFHCKECDYKFPTPTALERHIMTHSGLTPFHCTFDGCTYKCPRSDTLKRHMTTHTVEGQIRRKIQENRVHKLLQEWGYSIDCETTIKAKSTNCLVDTNRYFSRIDFHIVNCTNMVLLIECDEDQHTFYNLSCEFSRMSDVRASLVKAGYTLPIYWIRYNPNGKYHIGDNQVKIYRPEREVELKKHIDMVCSSEFVPENQVNIHYMFYDLNSESSGLSIMSDPDFPEVMCDVVSWTK